MAKPTIKGIFVKSHIEAIRREFGEDGVRKLEMLYGKPLTFHNSADIPISDEVHLIECALKIPKGSSVIPAKLFAFEAGRLHFRNFTNTPLGKIIFSFFRKNFKLMMLQANNIAGHVFQDVEFITDDLGEKAVQITMRNNDYPIDHFRGLFFEWMTYAGLDGKVDAKILPDKQYEYTMRWK